MEAEVLLVLHNKKPTASKVYAASRYSLKTVAKVTGVNSDISLNTSLRSIEMKEKEKQ